MKKILIILTLLFSLSCQKGKQDGKIYDAVVVGGGMAGISAAYHLQNELGENAEILLLEKENRLGGRILTRNFGEYSYELGASFDYGKEYAPKGYEPTELIELSKHYGLYLNSNFYVADNIPELLKKINPEDSYFFDEYSQDQDIDKLFDSVSEKSRKSIVSSFNVIHFGDFSNHVKDRQKDAFRTYNFDFRIKGNYEFMDSYKKILEGKYLLGAFVESVEQEEDLISVKYKKEGKVNILKAKSVIVATPASAVLKIIKNIPHESEKFVRSVKYTKTMVVVFITNRNKPIDFSYILTPDKSFNNIVTSFSVDKKRNIFSIYFTDAFIRLHHDWKNDDYVKAAYKDFQSMQLVDLDKDLLYTDSCFWEEEGTEISEETYKNFSIAALNPLPGVFLAGDYTFWNEYKIPYGIPPAYFSGQSAANKVLKYLKK